MEENYFTRALTTIEPENILNHILNEFANLCNQIIVADHKTIREREQLRNIVKKACGYISIGLERMTQKKTNIDSRQVADLIARYPLRRIFRVGFGEALKLKWHAEKWLDHCWFAQRGLRLTFWGEKWLGVLGGLLIKKPLYYDNYKTGVLYREFESFADVDATKYNFNQIRMLDDILSLMSIDIDRPASYGFLTYKNLILTLWVRHRLKLPAQKLTPLTLDEFKPFFNKLLPEQPDRAPDQKRKIPQAMKQDFLDWLSADTGLKDFEITARLGPQLENIFVEIESELGRVAGKDLDPRFIQLFLIEE
jgi:hypothetical protein